MQVKCFNASVGSVKDSVVGEERISQYLLAVLNIRGTPLHWKHENGRCVEGIQTKSEDKIMFNLRDLRKKRMPPDTSAVLYVQVTETCFIPFFKSTDGRFVDLSQSTM